MSFMKPEVYYGAYYEIEANHGETHIVPVDVTDVATSLVSCPAGKLTDYIQGTIDDPYEMITPVKGWLARMSAPGYLDCTDWSAHASEEEARSNPRRTDGRGQAHSVRGDGGTCYGR